MRILDTGEYLTRAVEMLREGAGLVPVPVKGSSMTPFLTEGDIVSLSLPERPPKRGDIVLYQRAGGRWLLHRVMRREADGSCTMLGDAQTGEERGVSPDSILAVAVSVLHKGKRCEPSSLRWRFYATVWPALFRYRKRIFALRSRLKGGSPPRSE